MRHVRLVGPLLFVAGVASLATGFLRNEATLSLFVIFPVVTATGAWSILGIVLMVAGFFVFFLTWPEASAPQPSIHPSVPAAPPDAAVPSPATSSRRWGGVIFLGPIPVVFGSDPKVTRWMLVVGVLLFIALAVLTIIALRGI